MVLAERIARLLRADIHAVLDRIEDPAEVLRLAVRDMQHALGDGEQALTTGKRRQQELEIQLARSADVIEQLSRELDLCFGQEDVELARSVIRKKLAAEANQKSLSMALDDQRDRQAELRHWLGEQREVLESLQHKAALLTERAGTEAGAGRGDALTGRPISDSDVEIALLREQRLRSAS